MIKRLCNYEIDGILGKIIVAGLCSLVRDFVLSKGKASLNRGNRDLIQYGRRICMLKSFGRFEYFYVDGMQTESST